MDFTWVFRVMVLVLCAALKAVSTNLVELTARAGETLTLWSGLNNSIHATLYCGDTVLFNCEYGSISTIKDNIRADVNNGPIVLVDVQTEDSKDYKLQLVNGQHVADYIIRLNVTELQSLDHPQTTQLPGTPENGGYRAAYISVRLIIVLILVLLAF